VPQQAFKTIPNIIERPLTSLKGSAFKAILSNNGNDLLFIHKNKANDDAEVWFKREGQLPLPLTNDSYYYTFAIFAADNEIIASRFNNLQQRKCEIVSINLLTKKTSKILDCADRAMTTLAYNQQRNTLYFNFRAAVNTPYSIYAYQRSTERLQQITFAYSEGNIRGDHMLSLSPTGERLAVFEYQNNSSSLLKIIHLSTSEITYHTHEFDINPTISWLSNDEIVFSDNHGVLTYNVNNKVIQTLLTNSNIGHVSANPLTGKIVFDKGFLNANIYQYTIHDNDVARSKSAVTHSSFLNYHPTFANRSNKQAYISTDDGEKAIMIKPENGPAYKTDFKDKINNLSNYHFSPDDRSLVASINSQLQLFDEKTRQWKTLIPEYKNIHYVHYSNEDNIIFSSDISGDWQIWRLNTRSGQLIQLTQSGGYSAQGNIDDGYLYLTKFNYPGLYRINIATGREDTLLANFPITSWNKWQVRANTIYFIRDKNILALNADSKIETVVLPLIDSTPSSFSVSFNERSLQHVIVEESSANIWSIEPMKTTEN
jgi:Tol biopolymer transport system component